MNFGDITVVIVTFKSEHKIYSCIDSIPEESKIIIIENSNDAKFKQKIEAHRSNVECFLTMQNNGYAAGNNFGLKKVKTKFALVLNPDTRLLKNSLKEFYNTAAKNNDFWLIGPNQDFVNNVQNENTLEVDNIKGYAMFFNIEKFNNKFFDENFFLYFEEIDLCKQIRNKKGRILVNPKIKVEHDGGGSVKIMSLHELEKNRNWHWMWSTFYYHKKHKGFLLALLIVIPKIITATLKLILSFITSNKKQREIYLSRLSGLINSIAGKESWFRPRLD